jgi:hypothetical protein
VPARTAAELPMGRRQALVWRLCWSPGFHLEQTLDGLPNMCGADELLVKYPAADRAARDSDGVYHLLAGAPVACLGQFTRSGACEGRFVAEPVFDVASIPIAQRCERAATRWPAPLEGSGPRAAIRRRLVAEFGLGCATCANPWALKIDHDHLTGLVRGYLCGPCNATVELCLHLDGCRFADYLMDPPARALGLTYAGHSAQQSSRRYLTSRRCYEIVMAGGISDGRGESPIRSTLTPQRS